jgi:hypothetical protein
MKGRLTQAQVLLPWGSNMSGEREQEGSQAMRSGSFG